MQETYKPTPEQEKLHARFIIEGSIHTWNLTEQMKYLRFLNDRAGLPFGTIGMIETGKGEKLKRVPYCSRQTTVELGRLHNISCQQIKESIDGYKAVYTYRAIDNATGRFVEAVGACSFTAWGKNLEGEALTNKIMHAETKAKRRATLEICGLAFLDDTEVEDMVDTTRIELPEENTVAIDPKQSSKALSKQQNSSTEPSSSAVPVNTTSVAVAAATEPPKGNGTPPAVLAAVAPPVVALAFEPAARFMKDAALFQGDENAIVADKAHIDYIVHWATKEAGWNAKEQLSPWLLETFGVRMNNVQQTLTLDVFRRAMAGIDASLVAVGR